VDSALVVSASVVWAAVPASGALESADFAQETKVEPSVTSASNIGRIWLRFAGFMIKLLLFVF
jgi:hypothetical protein